MLRYGINPGSAQNYSHLADFQDIYGMNCLSFIYKNCQKSHILFCKIVMLIGCEVENTMLVQLGV